MQSQFPLILNRKFRLGLIVNSYAGLGGSVGLKGSDGSATVEAAFERGAEFRAPARAKRTLQLLQGLPIEIFCFAGELGQDAAISAGLTPVVVGQPSSTPSTAADTIAAAMRLHELGVDLILFVGGDGTARNIFEAVGSSQAVLGLPSGVKMHSGVYAIAPEAAAQVIIQLNRGELVSLALCEVRDIDEALFRQGQVQSKYFGELLVPSEPRYVQAVKQGGREVEALVLDDIAADVIEAMEADTLYLFAPGSTTFAITEALGLEASLLGVDIVLDKQLMAKDLGAKALQEAILSHAGPVKLIITAIGGQGHIIGRGNQQLSPALLKKIGRDNVIVVATKTKLEALAGRPLLIDSNDPELDAQWQGYIPVITGYRDSVLYPLGYGAQDV
ncbi:ATP-NAD kinase family protein [Simiduia curdlanivorans]|uniref:ATP-NAD kinase family protein n=1 Tax=Simiduia curdlanivorans TaxID=1492769 RepID=A0ABV8V211_9GAMM|nr:ATP-NAD kinase family protein [Simiduia curdlanivorans]MDN3640161.1 ATP-NAD kinase family protein [Simiduia curdlanivorans]